MRAPWAPETAAGVVVLPASVTVSCVERYACSVDLEISEDLEASEGLATRSRRVCEYEKSQGMVTLHSGA